MKVSIIILTWNSLGFLKRCLSSIEANTRLTDYEIIIIDNNSQDDSQLFLKAKSNNDIYRVIFNNKNRGVAPARNQGITIAKGKYVLMLDDGRCAR